MTGQGETGSAIVLGAGGIAVVLLAAVVVLDVGAYLAAAARAQAAADAAALGAVSSAHPRGRVPGHPRSIAADVAAAYGAHLVACSCRVGAREIEVTVEVDVPAVVLTRFAAREVHARSSATLVPP